MLSCWVYLILCKPLDYSSSVHGILQARILEWVAIASSRGFSWPRDRTHISCIGKQILYHWAPEESIPQDLPPFLPLSSQSSSELVVWSCWGPFHSLPFPSYVASSALPFTPSCPNNPPWFLVLRCSSLISDSESFHSNLGGTGSYSCGLRLLFWPQSTCCTSKLSFVKWESQVFKITTRNPEMQNTYKSAFPKVCPEISVSEILHKERSPWSIIRVLFSLLETHTPKFNVSWACLQWWNFFVFV